MKTVLSFLFLTCLFISESKSQNLNENEVPAKVREIHKKKYPTVKDAKWKKVEDAFEASQVVNKKPTIVLYDENGKLLATETEAKLAELPKTMTDFFVANFKGHSPSNLRRIADPAGTHNFSAEIDHMRYFFDDKGNFLKQIQVD